MFPDITLLEKLMLEELEGHQPLQSAAPDPFYSEPNMAQLQKATRQVAEGQTIAKTMEELEGMEREPE